MTAVIRANRVGCNVIGCTSTTIVRREGLRIDIDRTKSMPPPNTCSTRGGSGIDPTRLHCRRTAPAATVLPPRWSFGEERRGPRWFEGVLVIITPRRPRPFDTGPTPVRQRAWLTTEPWNRSGTPIAGTSHAEQDTAPRTASCLNVS